MGESLTVRLFVQTQTYDIPCDPQQPAHWLLQQAKTIQQQRISTSPHGQQHAEDEVQVLYNRTRRQIIDLVEPIGQCIASMDVIDARTTLQTPDASVYNSPLFPWLRTPSAVGFGLSLHSGEGTRSTDGLFFQQLYAYAMLGKRTPPPPSQQSQQHNQEALLQVLRAYVSGSFDHNGANSKTNPHQQLYRCHYCGVAPDHCRCHTAKQNEGMSGTSLSGCTRYETKSTAPSPHAAAPLSTITTKSAGNKEFENVFDIVFKEQAIGMRLGADETKQYAVVKECFDGSEAKRYPEIQHGVVILAVNGHEVAGIGLSRILYRLREAPRPVVVRFGRFARHVVSPHAVAWS